MEELLRVLKALSDKNRLRIIKLLQYKPMCVCELAEIIGITQPSISKHLRILKEAGLIKDEKDGYWINYSLKTQCENSYQNELLSLIKNWINDDINIIKDRDCIAKIPSREIICKQKS